MLALTYEVFTWKSLHSRDRTGAGVNTENIGFVFPCNCSRHTEEVIVKWSMLTFISILSYKRTRNAIKTDGH